MFIPISKRGLQVVINRRVRHWNDAMTVPPQKNCHPYGFHSLYCIIKVDKLSRAMLYLKNEEKGATPKTQRGGY